MKTPPRTAAAKAETRLAKAEARAEAKAALAVEAKAKAKADIAEAKAKAADTLAKARARAKARAKTYAAAAVEAKAALAAVKAETKAALASARDAKATARDASRAAVETGRRQAITDSVILGLALGCLHAGPGTNALKALGNAGEAARSMAAGKRLRLARTRVEKELRRRIGDRTETGPGHLADLLAEALAAAAPSTNSPASPPKEATP